MSEVATIRKENEAIAMTPEEVIEYLKCKKDIYYFLRNYFQIQNPDAEDGVSCLDPLEFQEEIIEAFIGNITNEKTGKQYRKIIAKISRQAGKTTVASAVILWKVLFSDTIEKALCVSRELKQATDILDRIKFAFENLPLWLQKGVRKYNETSIQFDDGSYIYSRTTTANSGRGLSVGILYWDECAFIPSNIAEAFLRSIMPSLSRNKKSIILMTSTPQGLNHFYDFWKKAESGSNGYLPITIKWDDIPGRDEEFRAEVIEEFGEMAFRQEYEMAFIGSSNTLIKADALEALEFEEPLFLKIKDKLKVYEEPVKNLNRDKEFYAMGVDTAMGVGKDKSVIQVIKIFLDEKGEIDYKICAVFGDEWTSPTDYADVVLEVAKWYHDAVLMIETNDVGGNVATLLFHKYEYENMVHIGRKQDIAIRSTNALKLEAIDNAREIIEAKPHIIKDKQTIHELGVFEEIRSGVYKGAKGKHDDFVMALVWGLYIVKTEEFEDFGFSLPVASANQNKYNLNGNGEYEAPYNADTDDFF